MSKRYGERLALDDVSLQVAPGQLRGLLGPNGAGKTTLLRILMRLIRPDAGSVTVLGRALEVPRRCPTGAWPASSRSPPSIPT